MLKLGAANGLNDMNFECQIGSIFRGDAFYTQIATISTPTRAFTGYLDNAENCNDPTAPLIVRDTENPGTNVNLLPFDDGPSSVGQSPNYYTASFTVYVRFVPYAGIPSQNIPVTLGVLYWNIDGRAETEPWHLVTNHVVSPDRVVTEVTAFPEWLEVWSNPSH